MERREREKIQTNTHPRVADTTMGRYHTKSVATGAAVDEAAAKTLEQTESKDKTKRQNKESGRGGELCVCVSTACVLKWVCVFCCCRSLSYILVLEMMGDVATYTVF